MHQLFSWLSHAVEGAPLLALGASFVWGVFSIVLSPCHLASIPLIIGFISGQGRMTCARASGLASCFAFGILLSIALIGALTASAGHMMGDLGPWGNYLVAGVFFLVGLHLLEVIPIPLPPPSQVHLTRKGLLAALTLGLVFGIALGPCTFAYMAPMLAVTFRLSKTHFYYGASLLLAYGVGHCAVIVVAGTFTQWVQRFLNWNERSKGGTYIKQGCGILVLIGGVWLIYSAA